MANYLASDTDLTAVANAIRTKGGTSAQMAFPNGFISSIQNIPGGGGTDFTAEWERPSDWPALPNDIGTYSGQYFLFKKESGKSVYRVDYIHSTGIEIGITDASGNFTALLSQHSGEIDISNLSVGDYFWVRGKELHEHLDSNVDYMFEPVIESIVSNTNKSFYDPYYGVPISTKTVHFIAVNWNSTYTYDFDYGQNNKCALQCIEFHGGSWSAPKTLPFNCNKIVIDSVDISIPNSGNIYNSAYGRGDSVYAHVDYGNISFNGRAILRLNMFGASTEEIQSFITKLGNLSTVNNIDTLLNGAHKVKSINFTGMQLTNVTTITYAFSSCRSLEAVVWGESDLSGISSIQAIFDGAQSIKSISLPGTINLSANNAMYLAFRNCKHVQTIDLSNVEFQNNVSFNQTFDGCSSLENLTFKQNAGIANNISLSGSTLLTVDSLLSLFNALATVTAARTCTIGATNLAKLTAEQKAIATDKGWTLA